MFQFYHVDIIPRLKPHKIQTAKMKRDACRKCSLFLKKTVFLEGIFSFSAICILLGLQLLCHTTFVNFIFLYLHLTVCTTAATLKAAYSERQKRHKASVRALLCCIYTVVKLRMLYFFWPFFVALVRLALSTQISSATFLLLLY